MREIIPTIIPESLDDLEFYMRQVVGIVPMVQIDVSDGIYTETVTWPYTDEGACEFENFLTEEEGFPLWQKLDFEVDMMVENSPEEVERWIRAGALRVILHVESTDDIDGCITTAELFDTEVTLALKPSTSIEAVEAHLDDVSAVQFMGNDELGQHGIELDERVLAKIRTFHEAHPGVILAIDIGVREETIPELAAAGITRFASGSAIFGAEDIEEQITYFQNL